MTKTQKRTSKFWLRNSTPWLAALALLLGSPTSFAQFSALESGEEIRSEDDAPKSGFDWDQYKDRDQDWYAGASVRRMLYNLSTAQLESGNWPADVEIGEREFTGSKEGLSGTFRNGGTVNVLRFIARAATAQDDPSVARTLFRQGIACIENAMIRPAGGWPAEFPPSPDLDGVTYYEDNVTVGVLAFLYEAGFNINDQYRFLRNSERRAIRNLFQRGLSTMRTAQVRKPNGVATGWAGRYMPLSLQPIGVQLFDHPHIHTDVTVEVLNFLMTIEDPDPMADAMIRDAGDWLKSAAVTGQTIKTDHEGRNKMFIADANSKPTWAIYNNVLTGKPAYTTRTNIIRDSFSMLEPTRRYVYQWHTDSPVTTLDRYEEWLEEND